MLTQIGVWAFEKVLSWMISFKKKMQVIDEGLKKSIYRFLFPPIVNLKPWGFEKV